MAQVKEIYLNNIPAEISFEEHLECIRIAHTLDRHINELLRKGEAYELRSRKEDSTGDIQ